LHQTVTAKAHSEVCGLVAQQYHLTQREEEILYFLMRGRNRPYIQNQLHLADGTVKTHTSHIYAKLGVHTRQELIDLIENHTNPKAT
jgi:DNA-binding NarL/FixJ family response regulator